MRPPGTQLRVPTARSQGGHRRGHSRDRRGSTDSGPTTSERADATFTPHVLQRGSSTHVLAAREEPWPSPFVAKDMSCRKKHRSPSLSKLIQSSSFSEVIGKEASPPRPLSRPHSFRDPLPDESNNPSGSLSKCPNRCVAAGCRAMDGVGRLSTRLECRICKSTGKSAGHLFRGSRLSFSFIEASVSHWNATMIP